MNLNKKYQIIKIIDAYNVLVNAGIDDGITKTTKFIIKVKGKPVVFEGEDYGTLDYVKAELEVKVLYDKMALCQNSKIIKVSQNLGITSWLNNSETVEKVAPLEINQNDVDNEFKYILDHKLRVGDVVELNDNNIKKIRLFKNEINKNTQE